MNSNEKKLLLSRESKPQYKFLTLLSILYFTGWAATYPMVYKIVDISGVLETAAIFLFPLSYALGDMITEIYGYRAARQVVWSSLICGFIYTLALELVSKIHSANFAQAQYCYGVVFGNLLRVYFSLLLATLVGSFINIYVISKWKIIFHGRYFWLRSLLSTAVGELAFTIIGSPLSYVGVEPISKILWLAIDGYIFKMIYAFFAIIPVAILTNVLKKVENVDIYDNGINYNPFKFDEKDI